MIKYILLFFSFFSLILPAYAQQVSVSGTVQNATDKSSLIGATVVITDKTNATPITGTTTDLEGKFRLEIAPGQYSLKVQYLGFTTLSKAIEVKDTALNLGTILLQEEATALGEVQIIGRIPPGEQKGDTAQFNADAFKTAPDASAQDLVQKMPGVMVQDGQLQVQGEAVQQILIDGKPFFGTDVNAALQNLPANVIANIQVFEKKSDKAELSGFDDGETIKTINIVTKPNRKVGRFGKTSAGYGTNDRYLLGASVNFFSDDRRVTVTGLSNNVNTLNFSADPNNSGDQPTNGIISTKAIGLNYSETWGKKIEVSGSYFLNNRRNINSTERYRDFISLTDSGKVYTETNRSTNIDANHNAWLRLDYKINDRNRILFTPSIYVQHYDFESYLKGDMINDLSPLSQTTNNSHGNNVNADYNNNILYSHRFTKPGRSITFRWSNSYHVDDAISYRVAENIAYRETDSTTNLNQYTNLDRTGVNWETEVSYAEPIGKNGQIELEYEIGNRANDSDKRTYDYADQAENYSLLNVPLSNTFNNDYLTQEAEAGYKYNNDKLRFQVEASYQQASLQNHQVFPESSNLNRQFTSILPFARFEYKFSSSRNVQFQYRANTNAPSVGQLQDVIDYSNTLQVRRGNQNLNQSYRNWARLRYQAHNPETNQSFYASVSGSREQDYITNSTLNIVQDTLLNGQIPLNEGAQLIRPVNLNGYWDIRSYFSYGKPVNFISSNVNLNGSINHTNRPGLVDNELNQSTSSNFRLGLSLSSNISENIDFTVSTNSGYTIVKNTLRPAANNNYFVQTTRLRYHHIFWKGMVYRTDLNHQAYGGLSPVGTNFLLWNMSLGKKIFSNQRGEINLNVYDLLKQNNSIWRNISDAYVEDVQTNVLQRYFMLSFTYNIRYFGLGSSMEDFKK